MLYLSKQERIVLIALLSFGLIAIGARFFLKTRQNLIFNKQYPGLGKDTQSIIRKSQTININKADMETLQQLPGIGPSLAKRIVEYRRENGEFSQIEDLMNIKGMGIKKFEKLKQYVIIE